MEVSSVLLSVVRTMESFTSSSLLERGKFHGMLLLLGLSMWTSEARLSGRGSELRGKIESCVASFSIVNEEL